MGDERGTSEPILGRGSHTDVNSFTDLRSGKPADPLEKEVSPVNQRNIERQEPCYLLTMPGEILNTIARLLLVPGRVTAFTSHHHNTHASENNPPNRFSLLVVCRQIYRDFALLFYGENGFCLPPGPIAKTELYFNRLLPAHQIMIRHVAVPFDLADAKPTRNLNFRRFPTDIVLSRTYVRECAYAWTLRLALVCDFYQEQLETGDRGLKEVILEYCGESQMPCVVLGRNHIAEGVEDVTEAWRGPCASKAKNFLKAATDLGFSEMGRHSVRQNS